MSATSVRLDEKGRLTIPRSVREALRLEPGDVLFLETDEGNRTLQLAKAFNPFDVLAEHALAEYRAGRTKNIRQIAEEMGVDLDNE
ncbi:MAG: AbrB/MazE/SpoVT family DNA-binding domain-containing protein [Thermomicrobiales bacterium]|jgi:AbrB family looped-hinge helix DNA binding protein|nr:AbrB/MazE/SpoVT family DNA-binding domain-containing protein [Thermomicrobiales bacterium]MCC6946007.1 AbrB/MazE/SpoVT family DNA-binding domain-containing protein [Thermomicrobiales bacterium]